MELQLNKMNVLIVGFGKVGKIRHEVIKKKKFVKKIYVFDPFVKDKIKNVFFLDNLKNLNQLNIEAAFICVPTYLATKYSKLMIKHNINIFCEKPPATDIKYLQELKKLISNKKKINLMYGFNHRHHKSIKKILSIIKSKKFGKILWIRSRYGKPIDNNYINGWRGKKIKSGGGILLDQGIHLLDLLILFLGKIKTIKSILNNNFIKKGIEDNAFIILENYKKQTASLHSTLTQWRHLFAIEIFFEKGFVVLNGLKTPSGKYGQEILSFCRNSKKPPEIKWLKINKKQFKTDDSFSIETTYFLKKIKNKQKIKICNLDEAIYLMKLMKQIYTENRL